MEAGWHLMRVFEQSNRKSTFKSCGNSPTENLICFRQRLKIQTLDQIKFTARQLGIDRSKLVEAQAGKSSSSGVMVQVFLGVGEKLTPNFSHSVCGGLNSRMAVGVNFLPLCFRDASADSVM
jgi:hypothetical protein